MPSRRPRDRESAPDRDSGGGRDRQPSASRQSHSDEQALSLRDTGRSFAAIASGLGLKRASDARAAFLRGLARQPDAERLALSQRELERLDKLEIRIRDRDRDEPEKMERRLAALERMRETLPRS